VDTTKISIGEIIAAASGLALFIFMFLPWYGLEASTSVPGGSDFSVSGGNANAWEAFSFVDILLFLVVIVTVGIVVAKAADSLPALPQPSGLILAAAGALALLLVLFRLIFTPGEDVSGFGVEVDLTRKIGIFFGLLASAGIAYGGWRAMNEPATAGPGDRVGSAPPSPPAPSSTSPAPSAPSSTPPATPAGGAPLADPPSAPSADPTPPPAPPASPTPPADPAPPAPPAEPERPAPPAGGQPPSGDQPAGGERPPSEDPPRFGGSSH
jgi:hypothetical protein